jgi:uncharacterized phage-associated protein
MAYEKLKELILYIAEKSKDDKAFGATKLNKILFAADFQSYGIYGDPITEAKYVHLEHGPVPNGISDIIDELVSEERAKVETAVYFDYAQKRIVPLSGPNMSCFYERDMQIIDHVLERFRPLNGTELSNWAHEFNPWLLTDECEFIPFETVFVLKDLPVERAAIEWGKQEISRLGGQPDGARV